MASAKSDPHIYPVFVRDEDRNLCKVNYITEDSLLRIRDVNSENNSNKTSRYISASSSIDTSVTSWYNTFAIVFTTFNNKPVMPVSLRLEMVDSGQPRRAYYGSWNDYLSKINKACELHDIEALDSLINGVDLFANYGKLIASGSFKAIRAIKRQYPDYHAMVMCHGSFARSFPETVTIKLLERMENMINTESLNENNAIYNDS